MQIYILSKYQVLIINNQFLKEAQQWSRVHWNSKSSNRTGGSLRINHFTGPVRLLLQKKQQKKKTKTNKQKNPLYSFSGSSTAFPLQSHPFQVETVGND